MFTELRIDIDFQKHHPCNLALRLLKVLTFFTWLKPAPVLIYRTRNGLHIKVLLVDQVSEDKMLRARAYFNDDFGRLSLDLVRTIKKMFQKDVLFTARKKRWEGDRLGREEEVDLRSLPSLLAELSEMCLDYCARGRRWRSRQWSLPAR